MNKLLIPSSPNWFGSEILACAPDNTVICGSRQDLVIIKPTDENTPDEICCIGKAHATKIISIGINRNWGQPHKYAVSLSADNIIKLWDIETLEKKVSHNRHLFTDTKSKVIGACFSGDDKIISAEDTGTIIVWNFVKQETTVINTLFSKITLSCLSVCPFATWLVAFGLKSGLVMVADLRRTGKILFTLRGHAKEVVSLAWCPAPVNVFPLKPKNKVVEKKDTLTLEPITPTEPITTETKTENSDDDGEVFYSPNQKSPKKDPLAEAGLLPIDSFQTIPKSNEESPKNPAKKSDFKLDDLLVLEESLTSTPPASKIEVDMEISESAMKINSQILEHVSKVEAVCNLDTSSEDSKEFSSASSCDLSCSKKTKASLNQEEPKDAGNLSEDHNEVFHDATSAKEPVENWRNRDVPEPVGQDEEPRKEFLLASSAREANIYIWRAGTDGRMQTFLTVPNKPQNKKSSSEKLWITLCWITPTKLLSSSRYADLLEWTLPRPMVQARFIRKIHKDHWSVLFSIKAPILYLNEYNFLQSRDLNAWTTGMDRQLINTNIDNFKTLACYPCFGGSVNCLVGSPLDPNRLAIGTGEGVVNVWDLSKAHTKIIKFSDFYQKILSSVTALAWHPSNESSLAWGTVEGRIGIQDMSNKSKGPKVLPHFFKTQIFKLEWGPPMQDSKTRKLFVVSESKIAIFDPASHEKADPVLLDLPDNTQVYTMGWKPDYSMLLVSSKSGTLISYSPELKISDISYNTNKIQSIVWHPDAASDDASESKYCKTFVSIIKNSEFAVFDLNSEELRTTTFDNRDAKIGDIAWSPHCGNQLVVADDLGVAQIYDIESKSILSTYLNPTLDSLLSVHWSPVDPDYVIVGTQAHRLVIWKVSENPVMEEKAITAQRNKITKSQQKEMTDMLVKEKEEPAQIAPAKSKKQPEADKMNLTPFFYVMRDKQLPDLEKLLDYKLGKLDAVDLGDENAIDILDVFGKAGDLSKVFDLNQRTLRKQGKYRQGNLLALFQGDISTAVKEAIEQRRVDPWIISFCPMVSPKLWQSACETYVSQLLEEPEADPMEIVQYQLACHQVEEAVKVLCSHNLFKEAYLLASGRFGGESAVAHDVMRQWAKNSVLVGYFELAAACYISLGSYEEAATVLFRRSNVRALEFADKLAALCENPELKKAVTFRLNSFKAVKDKPKDKPKTVSEDNESNDANLPQNTRSEEHLEAQKGQGDELDPENEIKDVEAKLQKDEKIATQDNEKVVKLQENEEKVPSQVKTDDMANLEVKLQKNDVQNNVTIPENLELQKDEKVATQTSDNVKIGDINRNKVELVTENGGN